MVLGVSKQTLDNAVVADYHYDVFFWVYFIANPKHEHTFVISVYYNPE